MQQLIRHNVSYSIPESFFIEKVLEMLHRQTIDTYRARVMNPRSIVEEICELIKGRLKGRIPNKQAIMFAVQEAQHLLKANETYLNFFPFSKDKILSTIGSLHNDLTDDKLKKVLIVLKDFCLSHNRDYCKNLLIKINSTIQEYDSTKTFEENYDILSTITTLTNYCITELMYLGFTKRYLFRKFSNEFNSSGSKNFRHSFDNILKIIDFESITYKVVFKIEIPPVVVESLQQVRPINIIENIDNMLIGNSRSLNEEVKAFASNRLRHTHFYYIDISARDVFQALNKGKIVFAENFDLIHMGYSEQNFKTWEKVLIVNPQGNGFYYTMQPLAYELDGQFKDGHALYKTIVEAITRIDINENVKKDTKEKIKSSVRYLRLGNEALEVEHKFINYWFAIEHLFSDALTENNEAVINKIKRAFPKLHSIIFTKRLIKDFHDNLGRLKLEQTIPDYNDDLVYLRNQSTYDWIVTNLSDKFPMLSFRSIKIKQFLFQNATVAGMPVIKERIIQHKNDLEWHLSRMYRIRNAIVHDASSGKNIISITANLKYYLIFIISHIIKLLEQNGSLQSIEDLFALSEEMYQSLEDEDFPVKKLLNMDTHFDLID